MITPEMWKEIVTSDLPPVGILVLLLDMKDTEKYPDQTPYTDVATVELDPDAEPPEIYFDGMQQQWAVGEWTHYVVIQLPKVEKASGG